MPLGRGTGKIDGERPTFFALFPSEEPPIPGYLASSVSVFDVVSSALPRTTSAGPERAYMRIFVRYAQTSVSPALPHVPAESPPRLRARRGVSIAEMVVVLVISGIMLNIALPRFAAMRDRMNLRTAKQEFTALLVTARAAAVRQSQSSQFHVVNNSAWTTVSQPNGTSATVNQRLRLFRTRNVIITMGGSAPNDSIVYDARGIEVSPVNRRTYVLTLNNLKDSVCVSRVGLIARRCGW